MSPGFFFCVFDEFGQVEWIVSALALVGLVLAAWLVGRCPRNEVGFGEKQLAMPLVVLGIAAYVLAQPWFYLGLLKTDPTKFWIFAGLQRLVIVILAVFVARRMLSLRNPLRMMLPDNWKLIAWSLAFYLAVLPFVLFMGFFRGEKVVQDSARRLIESDAAGFQALMFTTIVLITPFFEEVVFRGLIQGGMRRVLDAGPSITISAVMFMLIHDTALFPQVLLLGAVLGIIYEMTRSLWAPIAVHVAHNAITFVYFTQFASTD